MLKQQPKDERVTKHSENASSSIGYYDKNAQTFYERTINADMSQCYDRFLQYLKPSGHILEMGCGVGRDALFFENLGYLVTAFDGSQAMVDFANKILKNPAKQMLFQEINFSEEFDGAWAAAALIHVPHNELSHVLTLIHQALKPNGVLLATFKHGEGQFTHEERTLLYE